GYPQTIPRHGITLSSRGEPSGQPESAVTRVAITVCCLTASLAAAQAPPVGQRPYELDWAGRTQDGVPPLIDFEELDGWSVQSSQTIAVSGSRANNRSGTSTSRQADLPRRRCPTRDPRHA
ncbi:MAG: hypothetical protein M5U09_28170, partial [Gammaproteobacteria bacterium]|nr:hypothetical protein [Gammaproteobacteria bacterium]